MKRNKVFFVLVMVVFAVLLVISCAKNNPNGPLCINKIKLTETPTCTPDVSYTVYIHQEATPAANVILTLTRNEDGIILNGKTGTDGKASFPVHTNGQWTLAVDSFNGFKFQNFQVEPLSNTFYAVNYGIPTLDLQLVSGNETIHVQDSTLVYKAVYHTKFERGETVKIDKDGILYPIYSSPNTVSKEGDNVICTINIPNSFEGYDLEDKYLHFKAVCSYNNVTNTNSNERILTKNWDLTISLDFHYIQLYDFHDNNGNICYYGGINNVHSTLDDNVSGYITTNDWLSCEIIDAANVGSDGTGTPQNPGTCMPNFTSYGCYNALVKIPTNSSLNNKNNTLRPDNSGWITVRFYDGVKVDVKRTFSITNNWSDKMCYHWCCTSRDTTRANSNCISNKMPPLGICTYIWDHFAVADSTMERVQTISITK